MGRLAQQVFILLTAVILKEGPQAAVTPLGEMMKPSGNKYVGQANHVVHGAIISVFSKSSL